MTNHFKHFKYRSGNNIIYAHSCENMGLMLCWLSEPLIGQYIFWWLLKGSRTKLLELFWKIPCMWWWCICEHIYICLCVILCVCLCLYVCMHTHTCVCSHVHVCVICLNSTEFIFSLLRRISPVCVQFYWTRAKQTEGNAQVGSSAFLMCWQYYKTASRKSGQTALNTCLKKSKKDPSWNTDVHQNHRLEITV